MHLKHCKQCLSLDTIQLRYRTTNDARKKIEVEALDTTDAGMLTAVILSHLPSPGLEVVLVV